MLAKAIFLLICVIQLSYAHPDGADPSACVHMIPDHPPFSVQTTPPPFTVTTSAASVSPGQQLSVHITRTNTAMYLRGFMIQARSMAGIPQGQFLPTAGVRVMVCPPVGSSATHIDVALRASITLTWVPPPGGFTGNVVFTVTAVHDYATFWTNVLSGPVTVT